MTTSQSAPRRPSAWVVGLPYGVGLLALVPLDLTAGESFRLVLRIAVFALALCLQLMNANIFLVAVKALRITPRLKYFWGGLALGGFPALVAIFILELVFHLPSWLTLLVPASWVAIYWASARLRSQNVPGRSPATTRQTALPAARSRPPRRGPQ